MGAFTITVGMHIMEGFLPIKWALFWIIITMPFLVFGSRELNRIVKQNPSALLLIAFAGAFTFVLSALKLPSVTGSCSHPTGMGLGAILFGPYIMVVIGVIVLLFQAILLAHGGISTLGANVFSMGIIGPLASYGIYILLKKMRVPRSVTVWAAATLGSLATYVVTAVQLALAHPAELGGWYASFLKFVTVFGVTQIPIAIVEGIFTVMVLNLLLKYSEQEIASINFLDRRIYSE